MADIRGRARSTRSHEISNVSYGHFGAPEFDTESSKWRFQRKSPSPGSGVPRLFQQIHHQRTVTGGSVVESSRREGSGRYVPRHALKWFPETLPATTCIRQLESGTRDESFIGNSPNRSAQVIFARAPYADIKYSNRYRPTIDFVAAVGAGDTSTLKLFSIKALKAAQIDEPPLEGMLELPLLSDSVVFKAPASEPVLQLYYCRQPSLIAFRQSSSSTLFFPLVQGHTNRRDKRELIRLKRALTLPISRTGGHPHADVTIHHMEATRMGVIDIHGNWSVWLITGRKSLSSRLLYQAALQTSGNVWSWTEEQLPPEGSSPYFDGWHRICFLGVDDAMLAVLVMNRRTGLLYGIEGTELEVVDLQLQSSSEQILDLANTTWDKSNCLVLTTSRLLLLRAVQNVEHQPTLRLICSRDHFLACGPTGLKLKVLELANVLHAFLHLSGSPFVCVLTFCQNFQSESWSVADPKMFELHAGGSDSAPVPTEVAFLAIEGPTRKSGESDAVVFVKAVWTDSNGTISEALYRYASPVVVDFQGVWPWISPWPRRRRKHVLSSYHVDEEDEQLDDFIVSDNDEGKSTRSESMPIVVKQANPSTRNWSWIFKSIEATGSSIYSTASLQEAESRIVSERMSFPTAALLREVVPVHPIGDIEEADQELEDWTNRTSALLQMEGHVQSENQNLLGSTGLAANHADLDRQFCTPLSGGVADRVRVQTERLARQVAMDQTLSAIVIPRPIQNADQQTDDDTALPRDNAGASMELDAAIARLSRYTTINRATKQLTPTNFDILAHLPDDINADPDEYSYFDSELGLAQKKLQAQEVDPVAKRRAQRMEAARKKRMEKAQASGKLAMSQELPLLIRSSSPVDSDRIMTQTERGDFGGRPIKALKLEKKKQKKAGF